MKSIEKSVFVWRESECEGPEQGASVAHSSTGSSPGGLEPMHQEQRSVGGDREVGRNQGRLVLPGQARSSDCILSIAVTIEKNVMAQ